MIGEKEGFMLVNHARTRTPSRACVALAALCAVTLAGVSAQAATAELKFDINALTANNNGAFGGVTGSGQISFSSNANSTLLVSINDTNAVSYVIPQFNGLSGFLTYRAGVVTGGAVTFSVKNPDFTLDSYTFSIYSASPAGGRDVSGDTARGFAINANTTVNGAANGGFGDGNGDNKFGTTDITPWITPPFVDGRFIHFNYRPNADGVYNDSDMEVYIPAATATVADAPSPVPLPAAVWAALPVLAGMDMFGLIRARHRRAANA